MHQQRLQTLENWDSILFTYTSQDAHAGINMSPSLFHVQTLRLPSLYESTPFIASSSRAATSIVAKVEHAEFISLLCLVW